MTASLDGGGLVATPRPAPAPRAGGSTGRARGPLAGHFPAVPWAAFHVPLLPVSFDAGKKGSDFAEVQRARLCFCCPCFWCHSQQIIVKLSLVALLPVFFYEFLALALTFRSI